MADKYATVEGDVIATTENAVLLDVGTDAEKWVPRSVIKEGAAIDLGDSDEYEIEEWFALKEGLI